MHVANPFGSQKETEKFCEDATGAASLYPWHPPFRFSPTCRGREDVPLSTTPMYRGSFLAKSKDNSITYLALFGSYARGEQKKGSDIDFLFKVDHSKRKFSLFDLVNLKSELEERFNRPVDLVSKLNRHVEPYVKPDLITLYEG